MNISPDSFENKLIELLNATEKEAHEKKITHDGNWTTLFKDRLGELGECSAYKYQICTSGFEGKYEREWLYDLVWYQENDQKKLIDIPLVVECEWKESLNEIKFDFEKLLLANSRYRLMICQSYQKNKESLKKYFEEAIQCYSLNRKADRYLIAILDKDPKVETFEFFVYQKN
jgi:hypothetical protein